MRFAFFQSPQSIGINSRMGHRNLSRIDPTPMRSGPRCGLLKIWSEYRMLTASERLSTTHVHVTSTNTTLWCPRRAPVDTPAFTCQDLDPPGMSCCCSQARSGRQQPAREARGGHHTDGAVWVASAPATMSHLQELKRGTGIRSRETDTTKPALQPTRCPYL